MTHQPTDPSAYDAASTTLKNVTGSISPPPTSTGASSRNTPASRRARTIVVGRRRVASMSTLSVRISSVSDLTAATGSTGDELRLTSLTCVGMPNLLMTIDHSGISNVAAWLLTAQAI
jgi:hypothetical protein